MNTIVAIVGRPNVGKSTLFNRLAKSNSAIVDPTSGVTRDRHYSSSDWNGKNFTIIDTGGYVSGGDDQYESEIDKQVILALDECDKVIFVVDVNESNNSSDKEIAKLLRKTDKPVIVAVNKADKNKLINDSLEFYNLGFDTLFAISAINGSGTGDLHAGKSSYINTLIGEERNIVKNEPGTTRDSIDTVYNKFDFNFKIIDTAGIRKKSKIDSDLEFYSVVRSIRSIENCDVCLLIMDATRGFDSQIKNIFWLAHRRNKGIIILVNKWDLVDKETNSSKIITEKIKKEIEPFVDVHIVFISCLTKQRIFKSLELSIDTYKTRSKKIKTSKLNNDLLPIIESTPPPSVKGKRIKIKYINQIPGHYPQFVFFANLPQYIKDPYKRFIENKMRSLYGFTSVPIKIYFRKK